MATGSDSDGADRPTDHAGRPKDTRPLSEPVPADRRECAPARMPHVVCGSGMGVPYLKRQDSLRIVSAAFARAAEVAEELGVTILLEAVNTRVDHPGVLFSRTDDSTASLDRWIRHASRCSTISITPSPKVRTLVKPWGKSPVRSGTCRWRTCRGAASPVRVRSTGTTSSRNCA